MIPKQEILIKAREWNLPPSTVEKDYVLGWFLKGISEHSDLGKKWIFKGGTCLKKCFFNNYRFSEDLDFTIRDASHIDLEYFNQALQDSADAVYEQSGIETVSGSNRFGRYRNLNEGSSIQGKLNYRGPLKQRTNFPRIKFDLTADKLLVMPPDQRSIMQNYSDFPDEVRVYCYTLEEVFAEKIRALAERARPRDLYDVVNLYKLESSSTDKVGLIDVLRQKCAFKKIKFPNISFMNNHPGRSVLQSEWKNMLQHQLPSLESFEIYWSQLPEIFDWLEE